MRVIETIVTVTDNQQMTITLPSDIIPGKYQVVIVIDEVLLPVDVVTTKAM